MPYFLKPETCTLQLETCTLQLAPYTLKPSSRPRTKCRAGRQNKKQQNKEGGGLESFKPPSRS
jgi:hypothetical protein